MSYSDRQLALAARELGRRGFMVAYTNYELCTEDVENVMLLLGNPEAWYAQEEGVTIEQWRAFNEANGIPRCGATTAKGRRCKNSPPSSRCYDAKTFVEEDGQYCTIHGGERLSPRIRTAAEAREMRDARW